MLELIPGPQVNKGLIDPVFNFDTYFSIVSAVLITFTSIFYHDAPD